MAVTPLFIESMETLRSLVKLTGADQPDTVVAIDNATRRVRAMIYDRIGSEAVVRVLGYASEENPTTTNALLRSRAEIMEADWVRLLLMRELPVLFMDASDNTSQVWNTEELTREAGRSDLSDQIRFLEDAIEDTLAVLAGSTASGKVVAIVPEPDTVPPRPGDSVRYPYGMRAGVII